MNHHDFSVFIDNDALQNICRHNFGIKEPSYYKMNRLLAEVMSSITASIRFPGAMNISLIQWNVHEFNPVSTAAFSNDRVRINNNRKNRGVWEAGRVGHNERVLGSWKPADEL